jgi:molybdate transport system substrate-binding protein
MTRRYVLICCALGVLFGCGAGAPAAPAQIAPQRATVLVFAAASLSDVMQEVGNAYRGRTGVDIKSSFAASSVLAKQIEAGAPADVFLSADREWMDYLEQRNLLKAGSRRDLLGNDLVLIAPADSGVRLRIAPGFKLAAALDGGRLACGDPDSVPAGLYARAALTKLGVWDSVAPQLARAENVRVALAYVARGETPLGIVYRTDAQAEPRVRIVDVFPADTHPPITYPVALTTHAAQEAARFSEFLASEEARRTFAAHGFATLPVRKE